MQYLRVIKEIACSLRTRLPKYLMALKGMKFINIVRTITEYKYADNIRAIFGSERTGLLILFLQLWSLSRKEHLVRILIARFQM